MSKKESASIKFSLMEKAKAEGVFDLDSGYLIAAPTATGKSKIGRDLLKASLPGKEPETIFVYLVPYKALAEEVAQRLQHEIPNATIAIATSDYNKPYDLKETDILVATYERAIGIFDASAEVWPTVVIADEASIIGDEGRGTQIEALISYFAKADNLRLYCLSAVLRNPQEIANWLGLKPVIGSKKDRPTKLSLETRIVDSKDEEIKKLLPALLKEGNVLVFCASKRQSAIPCAKRLAEDVHSILNQDERDAAAKFAEEIKAKYQYLVDLPEILRCGVATHHADLEVELRKDIVRAFQQKTIKVISATPTLAAGINVPARTVVLRDIRRYKSGHRGGIPLIPVSQAINMLGRAGRPWLDKKGTGYILVPRNKMNDPETQGFLQNVEKLVPEFIVSQIPASGSNILQFILSTVIRFDGVTRDEIISAYNQTLWAYQGEQLTGPMVTGDDLVNYLADRLKPRDDVQISLDSVEITHDKLFAKGGSRNYQVVLSETEARCECPAFRYRKGKPCKHIEKLQFEAIKGQIAQKHPEACALGLSSLKTSGIIDHPMYQLASGIEILVSQGFLEKDNGLLYITEDGRRALMSFRLSFSHIRVLRDRIANARMPKTETEVILWAMEDYAPEEMSELENGDQLEDSFPDDIQNEFELYLEGRSYREILKSTLIQKFIDAREKMEQILTTYEAMCPKENKKLKRFIRDAIRRVRYGCPLDLVPLRILELDEIHVTESARRLIQKGISDIHRISKTSQKELQDILELGDVEALHLKNVASEISKLITDFIQNYPDPSKDWSALDTLSVRTGIQREDLLDYIL